MSTTRLASSNFGDLAPDAGRACAGCNPQQALGFRFSFAYQPIVDVERRTLFGHEALVRGPQGEPAPSVLSQVNDDNRYRFDQACRVKAIKGAAQLGMEELLSINFMPNSIYKPEVCIRATLEAARAHDFPTSRLIFEATEGERVEDGPWLAEIMSEYKKMGFLVAIDDFGAGYAGLNLLADFQPDIVKLDMALLRGIDSDKPRRAIVSHLLGICAELGIRAIAEGVETPAERDCLRDQGVTLMQGYLFSRPVFEGLGRIDADRWGGQRSGGPVAGGAPRVGSAHPLLAG